MTQQEEANIADIANTANNILVINELIKQIEEGELESWNPVNIVVDAVGKYNIQEALSHHLDTLKHKLKEDIALL